MATVQIWNGSSWIDFYTLPNATSSTLGGVKIGNNITVSSGTISLTKNNVTSALGYTPLSLAGGNMSGHIYLTGSNASSSTGNTSQVVFGTVNNQHIVLSANDKALIINPTTSNTANQIVLYLNQQSVFPSGITSNGTINASTLQENGTALSSKYLGINAKAADSSKLGGQLPSYYALATSVSSVSEDIEGLRRELDDGSFIVRGANGDGDGNTISTTYATKNEATTASKKTSSANSTSKLFLIGATSQSANASTTYSNSKCYVGTDNCLYSNNTKVLTSHAYRPIQVNGSSILTSGSSTALNLKAGTNISLSNSNGTVTISSTASGGMTSDKIFEGAGDTSGYYTQTLSGGGYKMLLFEVNVSDFDFYLSVPTDYIKTGSKTLYLAAGNGYNGAMGIVEITASNTNFSASVNSGNIVTYNVNVYAYK